MANDFKKCLNGHYYQGATCPYCKNSASAGGNATSVKTEVYLNSGNSTSANTEAYPNNGPGSTSTKTQVVGDPMGNGTSGYTMPQNPNDPTVVNPSSPRPSNHTVFGNEEETFTPEGQPIRTYRETRKLVGWLVSYTLDAMGVDFKLYEGRNIIGRDADCSISVNIVRPIL